MLFVRISRAELEVHDHLSFEEWSSLALLLNEAARGVAVAFDIGDWLLYGLHRFGKDEKGDPRHTAGGVRSEDYKAATHLTGLYRATL